MDESAENPCAEGCEMTTGGKAYVQNFDCKQIAYYGKLIDSLTRVELISALEELAGAIHDCAVENRRRS